MMHKFIFRHIISPLSGRWLKGIFLLLLWTVSFIALPAISGWFLASCSLAFITANAAFSYLIPSSIIRLLALIRTATRYFERLENHKTTLDAQRRLQLKIFRSVAKLPYFKKQVNNNSSILENSTHGMDLVMNHILLWLLPFAALIQSFRGRIEITKDNLEEKAIQHHEKGMRQIERLEKKLQTNSFSLQTLVGLGFSCLAIFMIWTASDHGISAPLAIGIFFGMMAQAELAEMLFSGKAEK